MSATPEIPGFRIVKPLSESKRSRDYVAEQTSLQRMVVLKLLDPQLTGDATARAQLMEQGKAAARLTHPNLVAVFDIGERDGQYYMATEYLSGGSLRERLSRALSPLDALRIAHDLAQGLAYLHSQGYQHGDIKPASILFREDGTAVLGDLGIVRASAGPGEELAFATPAYISPERAQMQPTDARSDLYSLGVVLYEMLVGRLPFEADDPFQIAIKHISEPPPPLPASHRRLQPLLDRLLAKDPGQRFANASQLIAAIDAILESAAGANATRIGTPTPAAAASGGSPVATVVLPTVGAGESRPPVAAPPAGEATVVVPPVSAPAAGAPTVVQRPAAAAAPAEGATTVLRADTLRAAPAAGAPAADSATTVLPAVGAAPSAGPPAPIPASATPARSAAPPPLAGSSVPAVRRGPPVGWIIGLLLALVVVLAALAAVWWFKGGTLPGSPARSATAPADPSAATAAPTADLGEIERLLAQAKALEDAGAAIAAGPDGQTAVDVYRRVLGLRPEQPQAVFALERIASTSEQTIRDAIAGGRLTLARGQLDAALRAFPNRPGLRALDTELRRLERGG